MNIAFLSLAQSPPLSVPMRFFLTAPLFGIAAGVLLLFGGDEILTNRWSINTLLVVHMITLGVVSMVMIGALQQLLPVLMGIMIPRADLVSRVLHTLWSMGTLLLLAGMAQYTPALTIFGVALLVLATLLFVGVILYALLRSESRHGTLIAIAGAAISLLFTLLLMLWILNGSGWMIPAVHPLTNLHMSWGLLGWFMLLLIGVGYQVVPMFQITPEFPLVIRRFVAPAIFCGLLLWSASTFLQQVWMGWIAIAALVIVMAIFSIMLLRLQQQRKRRLPDVTLNYWRIAMIALNVSMLLWLIGYLSGESRWMESAIIIFLMGGILSAVSGMLFKIVPFLVWLHLNNLYQSEGEWQGSVPNVRQVIPERYSRWQFRLQMVAMGLVAMSPLDILIQADSHYLTHAAGAAWIGSFGLLLAALLAARAKYYGAIQELKID